MTIESQSELARQLVPCGGRLIVAPSPVDEESLPSGLILPTSREDELVRAVVYASDDPLFQEGEIVYHPLGAGYRIADLRVISVADVIARGS